MATRKKSHPSWVRGLKRSTQLHKARKQKVAPLVGAWIETFWRPTLFAMMESHPSWVRGLKRVQQGNGGWTHGSHPSWVRGLKLLYFINSPKSPESHPSWVRGLKLLCKYSQTKMAGRTPRGCVD